jgi:hypothetical protein
MPTPVLAESVLSKKDIYKDAASTHRYWMNSIELSETQEKDWFDSADDAVKIYRADKSKKRAFNILHPNVETIVPALYNSPPEPDVRVRDQRNDEVARKGAQIIEAGLRFQLDEYDFDAVALASTRDMQIPGRGVARVRWKTYWKEDTDTPQEAALWEQACCEHIAWRNFRRGPGANWQQVRWVAYEHAFTYDEIVKLCGNEQMAKEVPLDLTEVKDDKRDGKTTRELSVWKRTRVWEIWDKDTRQVFFIAPGYSKGPLFVSPDPYGLLDFFDCPEPLQAITDPDTLTPVVPYDIYKEQAEELAAISQRILILINILKVRGVRASEIPEMDLLGDLDDGQFVPSSGALALLGGSKGLDNAIWIWPIEKIIAVIRELVLQRDNIKQVIYEITGIADILRGATNPNETLGAQQLKAQFGTMRINKQQRMVQRFCRDLFRIKAEIISNRFATETLQRIIGEQIDPEVLAALRSDVRRIYNIDIETDSTIRGDLARAQENLAGFMSASAQFFQTFVPLIQSGQFPPALARAAVTIYGAFTKTWRLGKVVEDVLAQLETAADQFMAQKEQEKNDPAKQAQQQEAQNIMRMGAYAQLREKEATAAKKEADATVAYRKTAKDEHEAEADAALKIIEAERKNAETAQKGVTAERERVGIVKDVTEIEGQRLENENIRRFGNAGGPGFVQ